MMPRFASHPTNTHAVSSLRSSFNINTVNFAFSRANRFPYSLDLSDASIVLSNQHTAVVRVKAGTSVCHDMVRDIHTLIARHLGCDYGLIVDRAEDYSLLPVQVFQFLNHWAPVKVIAIVAHRTMSKTVAEIDKSLSRKPLQVFVSIDEAQTWIDQQLAPIHLVK
jgi:hypothetical protein